MDESRNADGRDGDGDGLADGTARKRSPVGVAARVYVRRGWRVVELRPRSKAPAQSGWQDMRLGEAALAGVFLPNCNVGLLTGAASGGLVDVDCDTIEAQIAATTLLPITPMMHERTDGRENGRFTHYWYQIEGSLPKTEKFQWREEPNPPAPLPKKEGGARVATDGALADAHETPGADVADATEPQTAAQTTMLIELRADGCQTMVPPSLHPDGGWLRWGGGQVEPLHPARVTAAELRRAVARTAAAALLVRYWPAQGSRDEAALALTGWLVKAGWMDDDADAFVLAVARAAQDEEWKRRALKAKHTRETIAAGRPVMGVNALAARLRGGAGYGAMVVTMVAQWLGLTSALSASHVSNAPLMSTQSPIRNDGHEWEIGHEWDDLDDEEVGTLFSEVKIEPLRWLWPGRLPLGKVTILDGDPGLGKSLITVDLAARVTTGRGMPDESPDEPDARLREPHGVVLLSAEDGPGDTIAPRLLAAGADLARVLDLHTVRDVDSATGTPYERGLLLPRDLRTLERGVKRMRARLVVIDPLMSFLDSSVNSFSDQDARTVLLEPLKRLAEENGATILLLRHLNKTTGGKAIYRGGGSIGFIGAARGGLLAAKDPDDPEHQRVLASGKSNLGPPLPSLRYHLVVDEGQTHPRVEWLEMCDYTADALVADVEEEPGAREEAEAWLEEQLAAGPRRGSEIKQLAAQAGISARTLRRARERVCERPDRHGLRKGAYSLWQLRPAPQTPPTELPTAAEA